MIVNATSSKRVTLGRLGENKTRVIRFDIKDVRDEFPGAELMVLNRRPGESGAYPVSNGFISVHGNHLDWTVQSGDLLYQGLGECELVAILNDQIAKSQIYLTEVLKALDGAGTPPAPWQSWVDNVLDAAARAEAAAQVTAHPPEIIEGEWYVWDPTEGDYVATGITAQGEDGFSPSASVTKSGSTVTISITDKEGTTTATVNDADPSAIIDDTAGEGDTDKVWSADKITEEVGAVKNALTSILVEKTVGETVTLTNAVNAASFKNDSISDGFNAPTISDGVVSFTIKNGTLTSPYIVDTLNAGTKKWIVGFKYKATKLNPLLGDPSDVRIHLGSTAYDASISWGNWVDFKQVASLDLTRIRFALRNFASVPAANSFKVEFKEMYVYDATDVSSDMCDIITSSQSSNYRDGTVTYGETSEQLMPDTSLSEEGKAADSKAVGDAIGRVRLNVKEHGVKGDGTTDDTDAINALFANSGVFYFPAGTYKITGTITLPSESELYGDGDQTVINMASCTNLTACTFRGGDKIYPYILTTGDHTRFHDFKLTGNNTTQEERHAGIGVLDANDCVIDHVTVFNINYYASQTEPNVSGYGICILRTGNVLIDKCYVEQCGYECIGLTDYSSDCVVSNCIAKNGWRTCIQVHKGCKNIKIANNHMIQASNAWDALFTLHGLSGDDLVENLRIEGNVFSPSVAPRTRTETAAAVIQLMSYCDGLWVVNNRVEDGDRNLFSSDSNSHLFVIGNLFQCDDTTTYRIRINTENAVIVGNVVENVEAEQVIIATGAVTAGNIGIS